MPRWPSLSLAVALLLTVVPATASAQTGGATAPEGGPPVPSRFTVSPRTIRPGQGPVQFIYRIDGRPRRRVRVRIDLVAAGARRPAARLELGEQPTGRTLLYDWTPGSLAAGRYAIRLHAVDKAGRPLRRTARASGRSSVRVAEPPPPPSSSGPGVFPVAGPWTLGGPEGRFGAGRAGHVHEGQDVPAAEGTPLVAPQAGSVTWSSYQAAGAGYYLVIRTTGTIRDLVFMHLREGSLLVASGHAVTAGQAIGQVGQTGGTDGPHLHFEIWPAGWKAGRPIDPLPDLLAWAGLAAP